tara:strand:- start:182 stop:421 length:240 start_codon:yes stop_codon:yes gene_type:complete
LGAILWSEKLEKKIKMVLIKQYKKHRIERHNGVIEVVSPGGSRFIVGLDDSKRSGKRRFINKANTVTAAKKYIDWKRRI